jgi:exopolyphosphatase/guanosine-5'-triphosphate,3'-diphosphate pyrophosphatase
MRVGAIDCGTNSIRLLIADIDPATWALRDIVRRMEVVRLGYGVDRTGRLDPERIAATLNMTGSMPSSAASTGCAIRFVGHLGLPRCRAMPPTSSPGSRTPLATWTSRPEVISGGRGGRSSASAARPAICGLAGIPGPISWSISAAGQRNSCSGTERCRRHPLSTDVGCVR